MYAPVCVYVWVLGGDLFVHLLVDDLKLVLFEACVRACVRACIPVG